MTLAQGGLPQLIEAVDDLGNSLVPASLDDQRGPTPAIMMGASMGGGATVLTIPLQRPDRPGKVIKKLRGTVEALVSAPRSNPLVIPLQGAAGKTFQNDERRVVVNSIDTNPAGSQDVIELSIDDIDELFPTEPMPGPGFGARRGMMGGMGMGMGMGMGARFASGGLQGPIQVITSKGQNAFYQMSMVGDSGRITLRVNHMLQMGESKEIRIATMVCATTKVPFEFQDLPMP